MRLVDIAEFYSEFGGGVRTCVHQKLEASAKCGVETTIFAPGPADRRERCAGGEILWVRSPKPASGNCSISSFWRRRRISRSSRRARKGRNRRRAGSPLEA